MKYLYLLLCVVLLSGHSLSVSAQTEENPQAGDPILEATGPAPVLPSYAEITEANVFNLGSGRLHFEYKLSSEAETVGEVKVGVALSTVDATGQVTIIDERIVDPTAYAVSPENSPLAVAFTYDVPTYLAGTYKVDLISRLPNGAVVAAYSLGDVSLQGIRPNFIDKNNCTFVDGEGNTIPLRGERPEVEPGAGLTILCELQNASSDLITVRQQLVQYNGSLYSEVLSSGAGPGIKTAVDPQSSIIAPFNFTAPTVPRAYYNEIYFYNEAGIEIGKVPFTYLVKGSRGYFTSASYEQQSGSEGVVKAAWSINDRAFYPLTVSFRVTHSDTACAVERSVAINETDDSTFSVVLPVGLKSACAAEFGQLTLAAADGRMLDTRTLSLAGTETGAAAPATSPWSFVLLILGGLAVLGLLVYAVRKRFAKTLLGLVFALVIFGGGADKAEAAFITYDMFYLCSGRCPVDTGVTMMFSFPNSVVAGDTFSVFSVISSDDHPQSFCPIARYSWGGSMGSYSNDYYPGCYSAQAYRDTISTNHDMTAPSTPGSYTFCVNAANSSYGIPPVQCRTVTVTAPPVAPTLVVTATPNRLKSSDNLTVAYNISGSSDSIEYRITGPTTFPAPNPRSSPDVVGPAVATPSQFFGTAGAISDGTYTISMRACQGTLCGTTWSTATFTIFSDPPPPPPSVNVQFKSR